MKLTKADTKLLLIWGFTEKDFPQIEEAMQKSKTTYWHGAEPIDREKAIGLLGRRKYIAGLSRSAFHFTAAQEVDNGGYVYFDSSRLFGKGE